MKESYKNGLLLRSDIKWNGWGWQNKRYNINGLNENFLEALIKRLEVDSQSIPKENSLSRMEIPKSRLKKWIPKFQKIVGEKYVKTDESERLNASFGRSLPDLLTLRFGKAVKAVDGVIFPKSPEEVLKILSLAEDNKIAIIPRGGGSSVTGGLSPEKRGGQHGVLTLDMSRMNRLVEFDESSQSALFEAGIYGPLLEQKLSERGYTLGHFPQSFEFSTLGGWVAARGAGQESNQYGKIERMIISLQMATPAGILETGNFREAANGPDLNQVVAGSEGILGVITSARICVKERPEETIVGGVLVDSFEEGMERIKEVHSLNISNLMIRLSDEEETKLFMGMRPNKGSGWKQKLLEGALKMKGVSQPFCYILFAAGGCRKEAGESFNKLKRVLSKGRGALFAGRSSASHWIDDRYETPYLRDDLIGMGVGVETVETFAPWSKLAAIRENLYSVLKQKEGVWKWPIISMCHISHSNANGGCLYFTILYKIDFGDCIGQWRKLKRELSNAIIEAGGTLSHHHGVGVDHREWLGDEIGSTGLAVLEGIKSKLDPKGIMNPGKVI